jgi:hypothetical protein
VRQKFRQDANFAREFDLEAKSRVGIRRHLTTILIHLCGEVFRVEGGRQGEVSTSRLKTPGKSRQTSKHLETKISKPSLQQQNPSCSS